MNSTQSGSFQWSQRALGAPGAHLRQRAALSSKGRAALAAPRAPRPPTAGVSQRRARAQRPRTWAHTCPAGAPGQSPRQRLASCLLSFQCAAARVLRRAAPVPVPRAHPAQQPRPSVPLPRALSPATPRPPRASPAPAPRHGPGAPSPSPRRRRPRPPGAPGGSCPGHSSPHEVVSEVLAPDIVRRLPHQRARHSRAGSQAARSALAAGPRSPMTPAKRTERNPHLLAGCLTTARPRLTAAAPRGSRPVGGLSAEATETIGSHAPHTLSPPLGAWGRGLRRKTAALGCDWLAVARHPRGPRAGWWHAGSRVPPRALRPESRGGLCRVLEVPRGRPRPAGSRQGGGRGEGAAGQPADCAQHRFREPAGAGALAPGVRELRS